MYSILGTTQDIPWSLFSFSGAVRFDDIFTDSRLSDKGFRSLLLQLSDSLTGKELQELKYLCGDVLSHEFPLETINDGFQLFAALEQRNMLSVRNTDFLSSKLIAVNRIDLSNRLLGIEGYNSYRSS